MFVAVVVACFLPNFSCLLVRDPEGQVRTEQLCNERKDLGVKAMLLLYAGKPVRVYGFCVDLTEKKEDDPKDRHQLEKRTSIRDT